MKLKDILDVMRDSTRIKITDKKGVALTANLHKRDITDDYNDLEVVNVCARYQGNGHTVRFYIQIALDTDAKA